MAPVSSIPQLGAALRAARQSAARTQGDVAQSAGVQRQWLVQLENGRLPNPSVQKVLAVVEALGCGSRSRPIRTSSPRREQPARRVHRRRANRRRRADLGRTAHVHVRHRVLPASTPLSVAMPLRIDAQRATEIVERIRGGVAEAFATALRELDADDDGRAHAAVPNGIAAMATERGWSSQRRP